MTSSTVPSGVYVTSNVLVLTEALLYATFLTVYSPRDIGFEYDTTSFVISTWNLFIPTTDNSDLVRLTAPAFA